MHKIFAKPLFLGKKVVFLPQCHSTNDELASLIKKSSEPEGLVLYTDNQTKGKGQRGNVWLSEPGKNVMMSVLLRPKFLDPQNQFYLNLITGLAIVDVLRGLVARDISLKWPNDVYVADRKIAGILIESNMRGSILEFSIVGVGLNVNQEGFNLPNATSMFLETGKQFDLREIMEDFLLQFEKWYIKLKNGGHDSILNSYHQLLMWRGEERAFKANDEEFYGEIVGIDSHGRLAINHNGTLNYYGIKEVEFRG
ncbi:biotin--[acetyl-CoA-carboxylase] ligase [Ekhidna sp.]|uniref:biotin--[acetyl-CoA-carboxylase] ligase n=1 Tax=Ekhidna sp. TaxID=2608089 RepID=UPI003B5A3591